MTIKFNVDAHIFRAAHACVSKSEARPYLQGVYLERTGEQGVNIVATDGYVMAVFHDKRGTLSAPNTIVKVDLRGVHDSKIRKAIRFTTDGGADSGGALLTAEAPYLPVVIPIEQIDRDWTFPDWRAVSVPPGRKLTPGWPDGFTFTSTVLTKVVEALRWADVRWGGKAKETVPLTPYTWQDGPGPVAFTASSVPGYVVAMPCTREHDVMDAHFYMPEADR
jgi:hypothetical protein